MNYKLKTKKQKGFSLVETIVYVSIFSIFMISFVTFLNVMTTSRINNQIVLEVNNQGNSAMRIMTQSIRNSTSFSIPNSSTLNLTTPNGSIIFSVSGGVLNMNDGSGNIALTNNKVTVNSLSFVDFTQSTSAENININLTLESANNTHPVNFYGSASLRI